ncbi:TetR/AcrR family transcriptional regulator (plasmid) [Deinococcus sp. KNUC1210]|uniref:TetR/AcrR family transcriptional regulator n=1 Tax=Deinococcus sp. KNUC1210 TaxID=2917691 RepID=UPI001EEFC3CA|nr:TetR/AcrR family transcriptional regulator [Deinococcus sp. KNUC1210]ULH18165.1 TetR/AcrR family transcriptional regulator [Deinococcus sp. KNUC1210]
MVKKATSNIARPTDLRADAAENRQRIIDAARTAFAENGLQIPMDEIARRAGVGDATLYRRFPTREALIAECLAPRMAEYLAAIEEARALPDAWNGLCLFVEQACALQADDQGLTDVLSGTFPVHAALEAQHDQAYRGYVELIGRAQEQGTLRGDFVPGDLVLLLMANAGVVQATRDTAPKSWRRFVALLLDGFRTEGAHALPEAPTAAELRQALRKRTP